MGIKQLTRTSLSVVVALLLPLTAIGEDGPGRLPPNVQKYPDKQGLERASNDMLVVYTHDDFAKVSDFYRETLAMEPVIEGKFLVGTDAARQDRPAHTDEFVWLTIFPGTGNRDAPDDEDLFGFLQAEIMVKKMRTEQELQHAKQKFAHLSEAWYPDFDAKEKLASCSQSTRQAVTSSEKKEPRRDKAREKEMMAQIQQLMAQGRHQEAGKLAMESARPGMQTGKALQQDSETDHWNEWIACLDEVDQHDVRTKIETELIHRYFRASSAAERKDWLDQRPELRQKQ